MTASTFLFATGIENSYPTINGGRTRIDEMDLRENTEPAAHVELAPTSD